MRRGYYNSTRWMSFGTHPMRMLAYARREPRDGMIDILKRNFEVGQRVLLYNSRLRLFPGKLLSRWTGPFTVTGVFPYGAVEVSNDSKCTFKVNGQCLKPYFEGDFNKQKVSIDLIDR